MANDNPFSPTSSGISDNPFTPYTPSGPSSNTTLEQLAAASAINVPQQAEPIGPQVLYSPSQNKMFVNGALFDADDSQSALDSLPYLEAPPMQPPAGYDWQEVSPQNYNNYIKNINEPGFGTLMARNFEIGGSNLKLLAGRGMQFLGAEETGQEWVEEAITELYHNQPYQREFTSMEFGDDKSHGAIDWFVANLAQQGPMLIESIITTLIGAGAGAVAGGGANPFTAVGGAVMALMGKEAFKRSVLDAAKKYMKGQPLNNGERKLLREVAGWTGAAQIKNPKAFFVAPGGAAMTAKQFLKQSADDALLKGAKIASKGGRGQAMAGGAFLGNVTGSYAMGVADIYGEVRETGVGDRWTAALGAIPYAALETIPEFLLAGRVLGLPSSALSPKGMAKGGIAKRAAKGFGVGGTLEGLTELGQETILLSATGQMGDAEVGKRLINAFAAGFGVGGPIGGLANLKRGKSTNVLNPEEPSEPSGPAPVEGEVVGPDAPPAPPGLPAPTGTQALPPPTPAYEVVGDVDPNDIGATQVAIAGQGIPGAEAGQQGVLNVFEGEGVEPATVDEINQRMDTETQAENNTVEQAAREPVQPYLPGFEPFKQMELPGTTDTAQTAIGVAQQSPETQQTAIGQQLLQQAQIKEAQAREEAAVARQEAELERTRAQRQREFDEAIRQRQEQQIKELETARIEQILAENERLTQENIQLKAPPVQQIPTVPVQQTLPGFGVPYGLKKLQRTQEAQQAQPAPTPVQKPDARQMELPLVGSEAELDAMNVVRLKNIARSLGVTGYSNVKKPVLIDKIKQKMKEEGYAIQERSPAEVDVQEQPQVSEAVPVGDTQEREVAPAPRKVERLRAKKSSEVKRQEAVTEQAVQVQRQIEQQAAQPTNQTQQERQQDSTQDTGVDTTYASPYEAWDDMGVTNIPLEEIPAKQRQQFEDLVNSGAVTYEDTKAIYDDARAEMELTPLQELEEAIDMFDTAADKDSFEYAAQVLVDYAFFNTDSNLTKKTAGNQPSIRDRALAYINNTQFSAKQWQAIDKGFVVEANMAETLSGTTRGKDKPWVTFAAQRNLLDRIKTPTRAMPKWYKSTQEEVVAEPIAAATQEEVQQEPAVVEGSAEHRLIVSQELEKQIDLQVRDQATNQIKRKNSKEITRLNKMFANADPEYRLARGPKLKEYFNENGELKLLSTGDGRFIPTTKTYTKEQLSDIREQRREARRVAAEREKEQLADISQMMGEDDSSIFGAYDDSVEDGMYYRAEGGKIENPVPKGKIELIVKKILKKLKAKPTVTVVQNYEDLRVNHPKLYARAAKGRPDFGTVNAIGYSVGDQVIIFSDFAKTEQAVHFVVAHETLGHFGFRAFMPRNRLNAIMREIYNTDGHIRSVAQRNMEAGMEFTEAVEEALADSAASLDISVVARFWNAVRNFLNKIGITFHDDLARYLISQSRRNLRTGGRGVVSGRQLQKNLKRLQDESEYGRYSVESDRSDLASTLFSQYGMNKKAGPYGSFTGWSELIKKAKISSPSDVANLVGEILERVQTLDNMATRSEGLSAVFKIFQSQQARVKRLHAEYEKLTAFSHIPKFFKRFGSGATTQELDHAGELLAYAALFKGRITTEQMIRDMPNLAVADANGNVVIDPNAFEQAVAAGEVTREDFMNGIEVVLDIMENGDENTSGQTNIYKPDFEITENVWRVYKEQRAAVNQAALDVLEANLGAAIDQKNEALEGFKNIIGKSGNAPTSLEIQTLNRIIEEYTRLYKENAVQEGSGRRYNEKSVKKAQDFIREINRALHNAAKVSDWQNGREGTAEFQGEQYQDIIDGLTRLNALGLSQNQSYKITNTIQNIYLLDVKNSNAEFLAKRTIMGAYVPFTRRGKFQVMVKAVGSDGRAVDMDDAYKGSMPYFQVGSRAEARQIQQGLDESFGNNTFKVLDRDGNEIDVKFVAEFSVARQSQPLTHSVNLAEFVDVLQRLNVNITPTERERIVVALTRQGERARRSLQRSGVAGWDTDVIRSVSEHLETQGHIAGKIFYQHKLNRIMLDDSMWRGNPQKLKRLEEAMLDAERTGNQELIKTARQEYDAYASMYQYSADVSPNKTVNLYSSKEENGSRKSKTVQTEGRGETYREEAKRLLAWYADAANIDVSTEDILSGEVGSRIKLGAVLFQLGGSVATALINAVSMVTHSIPYLGTYNSARGYGGGFGITNSAAAMTRAGNDMKNGKLADYIYVNDVANDETLQAKHNLSEDEAIALRDATAEGVLQAAQFNALVGTARGGVKSNQYATAIRGWMYMFSFTEQLNRRTTFLAAYRLERERQLAAGATEAEAQERAAEFGRKAVNTSQGEYAMYNRPEMARGNMLQYIFMYKQFVIVSVQLMKGMDYKGKLYFLGLLMLMSGIKGIPFADDLMDLVDTLAQKFGIRMGSVEKELAKFVDSVAPGWSITVMRGMLDQFTGATISTRLGFGDLVPLSGVFKAGADPWREAENFLGPVWSGASGAVATVGQLAKYGAEVIGLKDDTTSFVDIVRDSPVAALRGVADGMTYLSDGRITNARGSVISNDVGFHVGLMRMLGFYPAIATQSNDIVRVNKSADNYIKSVKLAYTQAYVKAMVRKDMKEANNILRMVDEHNRDHRGTEFEFRNFKGTAKRAYNMHRRPTVLRYKKSAPKAMRDEIDTMLDIYGINPNEL